MRGFNLPLDKIMWGFLVASGCAVMGGIATVVFFVLWLAK